MAPPPAAQIRHLPANRGPRGHRRLGAPAHFCCEVLRVLHQGRHVAVPRLAGARRHGRAAGAGRRVDEGQALATLPGGASQVKPRPSDSKQRPARSLTGPKGFAKASKRKSSAVDKRMNDIEKLSMALKEALKEALKRQ